MMPRQYSLVRFIPDLKDNYPFNEPVLFLGEIPNMPGHCVIADKSGKVHFGWHIENFTEIPDDEV